MSRIGSNRRGADGIRVENIPGFTTVQILTEIQNMMTETQCEPEQCTGIIIVVSMYNDIVWRERGDEEMCIANFKIVANYAKRFAHGHWSYLGPGSEKEWLRTSRTENGITSLRTWWSTSLKVDIQHSVDPVFCTRIFAKQRRRNIVYVFRWWCWNSRSCSSHNCFRQSARLRSSSGHVWRAGLEDLWLF